MTAGPNFEREGRKNMFQNQGSNRILRKTGWVPLVFALSIPYNLAKLAAQASGVSESAASGIGMLAIVAAGIAFYVISQERPADY
jgi:hypothetical protein